MPHQHMRLVCRLLAEERTDTHPRRLEVQDKGRYRLVVAVLAVSALPVVMGCGASQQHTPTPVGDSQPDRAIAKVDTYVPKLESENPSERHTAFYILKHEAAKPGGERAHEALRERLANAAYTYRAEAASALAEVAWLSRTHTALARDLVADHDPGVRAVGFKYLDDSPAMLKTLLAALSDAAKGVRLAALKRIIRLPRSTPSLTQPLALLSKDSDPQLRKVAGEALMRLTPRPGVAYDLLFDSDPDVRTYVLARTYGPWTSEGLSKLHEVAVKDSNLKIRQKAVKELGYTKESEALQLVMDAAARDSKLTRHAARAIEHLWGERAVAENTTKDALVRIVSFLQQAFESMKGNARIAAADALVRVDKEAAARIVVPALGSLETGRLGWVLRNLLKGRVAGAADAALKLLETDSVERFVVVAKCAEFAPGEVKKQAFAQIAKTFQARPDWRSYKLARVMLSLNRDVAVPLIAGCLAEGSNKQRTAMVNALDSVRDHRAVPALRSIYSDPGEPLSLRAEARQALAVCGESTPDWARIRYRATHSEPWLPYVSVSLGAALIGGTWIDDDASTGPQGVAELTFVTWGGDIGWLGLPTFDSLYAVGYVSVDQMSGGDSGALAYVDLGLGGAGRTTAFLAASAVFCDHARGDDELGIGLAFRMGWIAPLRGTLGFELSATARGWLTAGRDGMGRAGMVQAAAGLTFSY